MQVKCSHNAHSTLLCSLAKVKCIHTGDYVFLAGKVSQVFEMAPFNVMYELYKLPLLCKPTVRLVLPSYEEYYEEQTPRGMCVWCLSFLFIVFVVCHWKH